MNGFHFTKYDPNSEGKSKFEQLLDLFMQLLTYTSGDVAEAMQWLNEFSAGSCLWISVGFWTERRTGWALIPAMDNMVISRLALSLQSPYSLLNTSPAWCG